MILSELVKKCGKCIHANLSNRIKNIEQLHLSAEITFFMLKLWHQNKKAKTAKCTKL